MRYIWETMHIHVHVNVTSLNNSGIACDAIDSNTMMLFFEVFRDNLSILFLSMQVFESLTLSNTCMERKSILKLSLSTSKKRYSISE